MTLVTISNKRSSPVSSVSVRRLFSIVAIDKFFLLGAAFGLIGSLFLGSYLWMMRAGLIPISPRYFQIRELHSLLQFYLFLVPFILGFLLQSGPKLFETHTVIPRMSQFALPLCVIGGIGLILAPSSLFTRALLSLSCLLVAAALAPSILRSSWLQRLRNGVFILIGLLSLSVGALVDLSIASNALTLFWCGIVSVILATAQQFISGLLSGTRLPLWNAAVTGVLFIMTGASLLFATNGIADAWGLAGVFATLTFITYLYSVNAIAMFKHIWEPLGFGFLCANGWALIGAFILLYGPGAVDSVLHAWGTGLAVTLIIAVSLRLIGWITNAPVLGDRPTVALLAIWQVVVGARTLDTLIGVPPVLLHIAVSISGVVLVCWAGLLIVRISSTFIRQLAAIRNI